jgi:hypothetical protein
MQIVRKTAATFGSDCKQDPEKRLDASLLFPKRYEFLRGLRKNGLRSFEEVFVYAAL